MKPTNIEEFKALVNRYETITIKEIINECISHSNFDSYEIAKNLTGYGSIESCTLCKKSYNHYYSIDDTNGPCLGCVYGDSFDCIHGLNNKTYHAIHQVINSAELLLAFRNRAKHLRKHYAKYLK